MTIGFILWSIISLLFVGIGIISRKSDKPSGFFTFTKPPNVKEIKPFHRAVSALWFVAAISFEIMGIFLLLLEDNSPLYLVLIFMVVIWVISLMLAYSKIEARYINKSGPEIKGTAPIDKNTKA